MTGNLTVVGKADWIAEFLLRVESSVMVKAEMLGETDRVAGMIEASDANGQLFQLLSRPEIAAYFNQESIENWRVPVSIFELLHHVPHEVAIRDHDCVIWTKPHPIFIRILQNMKAGSQGKDSSRCNPLDREHPIYALHAERISNALSLLRDNLPDFYFMASTFLRKMIFVDEYSSFRGATSYYARGLSYFRPRESWDVFVWAEELVHEGTHNQVHALLTFDPLVIGPNRLTQDVPGPLRPDPRHHFGNFQALHVISRLLRLNETLAAAGLETDKLRKRNAELIEKCKVPYTRLATEAQLTEIGRAIFEEETAPAFT
jgi:hypothetical protein